MTGCTPAHDVYDHVRSSLKGDLEADGTADFDMREERNQ